MNNFKIKFTEKEIFLMVDHYNEGLSFKQIGKLFGCGEATIWNRIHLLVDSRPSAINEIVFTEEDIELMVKYYDEGMSYTQVGELFNCNYGTIWNRINLRVAPRPNNRNLKTFTDEELNLMDKCYEEGFSFEHIGKLFNCSSSVVPKKLSSRVKIRPANRGTEVHSKRFNAKGYVDIKLDKDDPFITMCTKSPLWCQEHRYVMAQYLGRCLLSNESVHHINNIRSDNRIENLQLRIGGHGNGATYKCSDCGSDRIHPVSLGDE